MNLLKLTRPGLAGLLLCALPALGSQQVPVDELRVRDDQLEYRLGPNWHRVCSTRKLPAGTPLVHWAPAPDIERWLARGGLDPAELDYLVTHGTGAAGGGFYVSLSPSDSANYGPRGVLARPTRPMRVYTLPVGQELSRCPYTPMATASALTVDYSAVPADLPPELARSDEPGVQEVFPQISLVKLQAAGVDAIQYSTTWMNVIRPEPLAHLEEMTVDAFFSRVRSWRPWLSTLLDFDQWFDLFGRPELATAAPLADRAARGLPLDEASLEKLYRDAFYTDADGRDTYPIPRGMALASYTELSSRILERVRPLFARDYRARLAKQPVPDSSGLDLGRVSLLTEMIMMRTMPAAIDPEMRAYSRVIPRVFDRPAYSTLPSLQSLGGWSQSYYYWAVYAHPYQVLLAAAEGDTAPWKRDTLPDLDRTWEQLHTNRVFEASQPDEDASSSEYMYLQLYGQLPAFRELPEVARGVQADDHQLGILRANPWLVVSDVAAGAASGTWTVTVEFPSARTWRRQSGRLGAELRARLEQAEQSGALADPAGPQARALTVAMLKALLRGQALRPEASMVQDLGLRSLSPFGEARTLAVIRFVYEHLDPDNLYKLSPREVYAERMLGQLRRQQVDLALWREGYRDPRFPKLFDAPGMWRAGLEVDAPGIDEAALVARGKAFFLRPEIARLVRDHRYAEVRARIWAAFPQP